MGRPYLGSAVAHLIIGCICVAAGIAYIVLLAVYVPDNQNWQNSTNAAQSPIYSSTQSPYVLRTLQDNGREWVSFLLASKIWCGFWFVLTGIVGASTREKNCSETAYLTLSVLNVILWAPAMMVLNALTLVSIFLIVLFPSLALSLQTGLLWILVFPAIGMFFGLIEFILSIVSCSMVCCCSRTAYALKHTRPAGYQYEMKYAV